MHLFQIYLGLSIMLFAMGTPIGIAFVELIAKDRLPKPYRRNSFLKKLAIVGGIELLALGLFLSYAWYVFDPIMDRVYVEAMKMYFMHLAAAMLIQAVVWPATRRLLAREPESSENRRAVLMAR